MDTKISQMLPAAIYQAAVNANVPGLSNPFATMADVSGGVPLDYKIVAGVMRNNVGTFEMITTGNHSPMNVDGLTQSAVQVNVDYTSLGATDVVSFVTGVDDTFAGIYQTGATVGTTVAGIKISKPKVRQDAHLITHSGGGVFSFPASLGGSYASSSYNTSTGLLRIYHEATDNNYIGTQDLPGSFSEITKYECAISSLPGNRTDLYLLNPDGTQKTKANPEVNRFYFNRANLSLDPNIQDPVNVNEVGGNIWFIGIFKV